MHVFIALELSFPCLHVFKIILREMPCMERTNSFASFLFGPFLWVPTKFLNKK